MYENILPRQRLALYSTYVLYRCTKIWNSSLCLSDFNCVNFLLHNSFLDIQEGISYYVNQNIFSQVKIVEPVLHLLLVIPGNPRVDRHQVQQ